MDRNDAINEVRRFKEAITDTFRPKKVFLYGSYSKGTYHEDSDIDVAVVVDKMQGDWFANVPKLWTIGRKINVLIEPVLIEECNPSVLYEDVVKTGIAV